MKADPPDIASLAVYLHERRIGIINRLAGDRHLLAFEPDYIDDPDRPTLSLSFKGQAGGFVSPPSPVSLRLPPFFSNLLPEGHLRRYLARLAGVKPEREFFLLAALGADLPGAVTVAPHDGDIGDAALRRRRDEPEKDGRQLRFSLAGVQLKFSAVMEASGGLTIPADGMGGAWIVKLPSAQFRAVPENEYAMLELARTVGIDVPPARLIDLSDITGLPAGIGELDGKALAVRRFDRGLQGQRIHVEDFAQVFGFFPEQKYERRSYANIAAVLSAETGEAGAYEFVRRLAFSVMIGNADMHLKNWSLLYLDGRTPTLSPAYDFVATLPYIPDDRLALTFGGSRSLAAITREQVRRFADRARLPANPVWDIVEATATATVRAWNDLSQRGFLPGELDAQIDRQIRGVAEAVSLRRAGSEPAEQGHAG